jgi:hypothetical protein
MNTGKPRKPTPTPAAPPTGKGAGKVANKLAQKQSRWQRVARYGWDKQPG